MFESAEGKSEILIFWPDGPGSKMWNPAIIVKHHVSPCSYIVESMGMNTATTGDLRVDQPKLP